MVCAPVDPDADLVHLVLIHPGCLFMRKSTIESTISSLRLNIVRMKLVLVLPYFFISIHVKGTSGPSL